MHSRELSHDPCIHRIVTDFIRAFPPYVFEVSFQMIHDILETTPYEDHFEILKVIRVFLTRLDYDEDSCVPQLLIEIDKALMEIEEIEEIDSIEQ